MTRHPLHNSMRGRGTRVVLPFPVWNLRVLREKFEIGWVADEGEDPVPALFARRGRTVVELPADYDEAAKTVWVGAPGAPDEEQQIREAARHIASYLNSKRVPLPREDR